MAHASKQETTTNQESIDISPMLNDVNRVLHMHLTNLLNPVLSERQNIREILKKMPFVINLEQENEVLKQTNAGLNLDINTMKGYYENTIKEKESVIQEMVQKLEQLEKGTVQLEVKEKNNQNKEEFTHEISHDENTKITKNTLTMATNDNLGRFMTLMSGEDTDEDTDEEYEYDEDESEQNDEEEDNDEEDENDHDDEQESNEEENKINPFPFDSTAGMNFAHGIHSKDISKAPFVWSTLCKYAPKEVREAYPDLDWSITDRYKKEVTKQIGDHVEITSNGTIESNSDKDTTNLEEDEVEEDEVEEDEVEEDEVEEDEVEEDEEDEVEEDEVEEDDEEEAMEVEDITIDGVDYLTTGSVNGDIYKLDSEGEILEDENGDWVKVGYFKDGVSFFI